MIFCAISCSPLKWLCYAVSALHLVFFVIACNFYFAQLAHPNAPLPNYVGRVPRTIKSPLSTFNTKRGSLFLLLENKTHIEQHIPLFRTQMPLNCVLRVQTSNYTPKAKNRTQGILRAFRAIARKQEVLKRANGSFYITK